MKLKINKTVGALLVLTLKDGKQMKEAGRANKTRCNDSFLEPANGYS